MQARLGYKIINDDCASKLKCGIFSSGTFSSSILSSDILTCNRRKQTLFIILPHSLYFLNYSYIYFFIHLFIYFIPVSNQYVFELWGGRKTESIDRFEFDRKSIGWKN